MDALRQIDSWPVPHGAVAVISREGLLAQRGDVNNRGRWASITKLFTSYAVLMAVQDEEFGLDDSAGPPTATVRHLLAHTSGLPFEGASPIARPSAQRIYSNTGFDLLAAVINDRTGYLFPDYLALQVLEPLGIDAQLQGRPSEGLVGDLSGLASFASELLSPSLLGRDLFSQAITVAFPGLAGVLPGIGRYNPLDWGLGFELRGVKNPHWTGRTNSPETFGHFGGAGSFLWVDPVPGLALCGLSGRQFGDWALEAWPAIADAVLAELS
jgi:CubicO group peptidase (beta-lactamase class C family)